MDAIKILKRAWHIVWNHRALWVFGLILAITAGGTTHGRYSGGNPGGGSDGNNGWTNIPPSGQPFYKYFESRDLGQLRDLIRDGFGSHPFGTTGPDLSTLIMLGVILAIMLVVIGSLMAIGRYVAETATIRMVDEYEGTGTKTGVRQGFRYGWSKTSWRLFLINLLVNLPGLFLVLLLGLLGYGIYLAVEGGSETLTITSIIAGVGIAFLLIFLFIILYVVLVLLRNFFWRVCALEQVGVAEAIRRGYEMVRRNWKSVGLMWLVMIGLGLAWSLVSLIVLVLMFPLFIMTILAGVAVAGVPGLLLGALTSLFLTGPWNWVVAGIIVLPIFCSVAFSPAIFVEALAQVFRSSVWTLTYREIKVLETLKPVEVPVEKE